MKLILHKTYAYTTVKKINTVKNLKRHAHKLKQIQCIIQPFAKLNLLILEKKVCGWQTPLFDTHYQLSINKPQLSCIHSGNHITPSTTHKSHLLITRWWQHHNKKTTRWFSKTTRTKLSSKYNNYCLHLTRLPWSCR